MAANNKIILLAHDAGSLSAELTTLAAECHKHEVHAEILAIAKELAQLSDTLSGLTAAVDADPAQYTDAFQEDLQEITDELIAVFVELQDCCTKLGAMTINASGVAWFFKKGRVTRLLRHLEALRGTLLVMRTVLWHGKDYGTHQSDRLAESSPYTMHEDRVILESILAQNRDAILNLHDLLDSANISHKVSSKPGEPSRAGAHYKQISDSTGIDTLSIPDILPPLDENEMTQASSSDKEVSQRPLRHIFSKRGVRLGVHMSILDLSACEAPQALKKKWIQEADNKHRCVHAEKPPSTLRNLDGLTPFPELSRISEVDSTSAATSGIYRSSPHADEAPIDSFAEMSLIETSTPTRELSCPPNTPHEATPDVEGGKISGNFKQVLKKTSKPSLRPPPNIRDQSDASG